MTILDEIGRMKKKDLIPIFQDIINRPPPCLMEEAYDLSFDDYDFTNKKDTFEEWREKLMKGETNGDEVH